MYKLRIGFIILRRLEVLFNSNIYLALNRVHNTFLGFRVVRVKNINSAY